MLPVHVALSHRRRQHTSLAPQGCRKYGRSHHHYHTLLVWLHYEQREVQEVSDWQKIIYMWTTVWPRFVVNSLSSALFSSCGSQASLTGCSSNAQALSGFHTHLLLGAAITLQRKSHKASCTARICSNPELWKSTRWQTAHLQVRSSHQIRVLRNEVNSQLQRAITSRKAHKEDRT